MQSNSCTGARIVFSIPDLVEPVKDSINFTLFQSDTVVDNIYFQIVLQSIAIRRHSWRIYSKIANYVGDYPWHEDHLTPFISLTMPEILIAAEHWRKKHLPLEYEIVLYG